jgi:hypothetical protein
MRNKSVYRKKLIRALNSAFREVNTLQPFTAVEACALVAKISYEAIKK